MSTQLAAALVIRYAAVRQARRAMFEQETANFSEWPAERAADFRALVDESDELERQLIELGSLLASDGAENAEAAE